MKIKILGTWLRQLPPVGGVGYGSAGRVGNPKRRGATGG